MSDDISKMVQQTTNELETAKRVLQDLANEITAMVDVVQPALERQITALRSARMTTVTEIQTSLVALRDIRKFFLEDDYQREFDRLERFVKLCRELQALKDDGTLDALTDVVLKMAAVK